MAEPRRTVVFDVVGTFVGYERMLRADERLGDRLRAEGMKLWQMWLEWLETAEREYTYISKSGRYNGSAQGASDLLPDVVQSGYL